MEPTELTIGAAQPILRKKRSSGADPRKPGIADARAILGMDQLVSAMATLRLKDGGRRWSSDRWFEHLLQTGPPIA